MRTKLYWVDGPWLGRLALAARPRGGEWLEDELAGWSQAGVDAVFSLLTDEEERDLDLVEEASQTKAHGMDFFSFPIMDREVPHSESELAKVLERVERQLSSGRNVVVHCRQGIGRTGLVAACLLLMKGQDPQTAVKHLSAARGAPVPETSEQRQWIDHFATTFASAE